MSIKALTVEHIKAFQKFGRQDGDDSVVILKMFDPRGGSTWYFTELDTDQNSEEYGIGFGFVILNNWVDEAECGNIDIFEILNLWRIGQLTRENCPDLTKVRMGAVGSVMVVERDIHFPIGKVLLSEVINKIKNRQHV